MRLRPCWIADRALLLRHTPDLQSARAAVLASADNKGHGLTRLQPFGAAHDRRPVKEELVPAAVATCDPLDRTSAPAPGESNDGAPPLGGSFCLSRGLDGIAALTRPLARLVPEYLLLHLPVGEQDGGDTAVTGGCMAVAWRPRGGYMAATWWLRGGHLRASETAGLFFLLLTLERTDAC